MVCCGFLLLLAAAGITFTFLVRTLRLMSMMVPGPPLVQDIAFAVLGIFTVWGMWLLVPEIQGRVSAKVKESQDKTQKD